jgi:hypothetical protein
MSKATKLALLSFFFTTKKKENLVRGVIARMKSCIICMTIPIPAATIGITL